MGARSLVVGHLSVARIATALGVSWNTVNDAVLAEGRRVLIADPARLEWVRVLEVDEHVWQHTRRGNKYVTVIIDLTPCGTAPALSAVTKLRDRWSSTFAVDVSVLGSSEDWRRYRCRNPPAGRRLGLALRLTCSRNQRDRQSRVSHFPGSGESKLWSTSNRKCLDKLVASKASRVMIPTSML